MRERTCGNLDGEECPYMEYDSGCPIFPHNHFDTEACRPMEWVVDLSDKIKELEKENKRLLEIEAAAKLHSEEAKKYGASYNTADKILNFIGPDGKKVEVKIEENYLQRKHL